jgi:Ca2+-binding RTX toxin-like protein
MVSYIVSAKGSDGADGADMTSNVEGVVISDLNITEYLVIGPHRPLQPPEDPPRPSHPSLERPTPPFPDASSVRPDIVIGVWPPGHGTLKGSSRNDFLIGHEGHDKLYGYKGNDKLFGGEGKDYISGSFGRDYICGGAGNDTLYGGPGKDAFVFDAMSSRHSGRDTIKDFRVVDDTILLDNAVFSMLGKNGALKASAFWASASGKAHDRSDRILYDEDSGILSYDADGSGKGAAVAFAIVSKNLALTHKDFEII